MSVTIDDTYGHPRFFKLIEKMAELHANKNRDYGNGNPLGNFMTVEDLGVDPFLGVLVRMSDKWTRICSLTKQGENHVKDESIEDTLLDLANYSLLALVIRAEVKGKADDSSSTLVADPSTYIAPTGSVSETAEDIHKTFTCLTCTNSAASKWDTGTNCYYCVFNGKTPPGAVDYYVDQRQVASLAGKGVVDELVEYCCGNIYFCTCDKCQKARFKNEM